MTPPEALTARRTTQALRALWEEPDQALAFLTVATVLLVVALRGGSYDLVVMQEEALLLWTWVGLAVAVGVARRIHLTPTGALALAATVAMSVWTLVGLTWTSSAERTMAEGARGLFYAGVLGGVFLFLDRRTWRAAAAGVFTAAAAVTLLAVASRLLPGGVFPENHVRLVFGSRRLSYPFDYWNAVAAWSAMCLAMALAWSAHARSSMTRMASSAMLPVCGAALYLTYSRAGMLVSATAVVAVVALSRNRWVAAAHASAGAIVTAVVIAQIREQPDIASAAGGRGGVAVTVTLVAAALACGATAFATTRLRGDARWRLPPRTARASLAVGLAVAATVAATVAAAPLGRALDEFRGDRAGPRPSGDPAARFTSFGGARSALWSSAIEAFGHEPAQGLGAGTFEFWWNRDGNSEFLRDAHSLYLEQLAEGGIPGGVLVVIVVGALAAGAMQARRTTDTGAVGVVVGLGAAVIVFVVHAGVDWLWEVPAVAVLALLCGGIGALQAARTVTIGRFGRVSIAAVAAAVVLLQVPGLVSTSLSRGSQRAYTRGEIAEAAARAKEAADAQPWAASPYVAQALVAEATGRLDAARTYLLEAIERERLNWRHRLLLARVEAERGETEAAIRRFREARRLRPASSFFGDLESTGR